MQAINAILQEFEPDVFGGPENREQASQGGANVPEAAPVDERALPVPVIPDRAMVVTELVHSLILHLNMRCVKGCGSSATMVADKQVPLAPRRLMDVQAPTVTCALLKGVEGAIGEPVRTVCGCPRQNIIQCSSTTSIVYCRQIFAASWQEGTK